MVLHDADPIGLASPPHGPRSSAPCHGADRVLRLGGHRAAHQRDAWPQDPRLFHSDRRKVFAEHARVVASNAGDRCTRGCVEDVGRVESTAQAHLDYREIDSGVAQS